MTLFPRMFNSARLVAGTLFVLALAAPVLPQFSVPEGVGTITDPEFGELPKEIIWAPDKSHMILVPRGEYRLGVDDPGLKNFSRNEGPAVTVTLDPFYIDKYEVSYDKYMSLADRVGLNKPRTTLNADLLTEGHPIVSVSHDSAAEYARVMSKALPTEAEWEAAARGPEAFLYPWGNDPKGGTPVVGMGSLGMTKPVDDPSLDVSSLGIVGMGGNVGEWCVDGYVREYYTRVAGQKNPVIDEASGETRSVRGGDYYAQSDGRTTLRNACVGTHTRDEVGFRTVFRLRPAPVATPTPAPLIRATPTPRPEEIFSSMMQELLPFFQDPIEPLPDSLAASEVPTAPLPFVNMTPHDIRIGFFSAENRKLMRQFPSSLEAGSYKQLNVPKDTSVLILAYAPASQKQALINLGPISTTSSPLTIIPAHVFNAVVETSGNTLDPSKGVETIQHYGKTFQPMWNEFQIFNHVGTPVEVKVEREKEVILTQLIEPGEALNVNNVRPGNIQISATYLGASDERASNVVNFRNDEKADYRLFILGPGDPDGPTVRVVTKKMPLIAIQERDIRITGDKRETYVLGSDGKK